MATPETQQLMVVLIVVAVAVVGGWATIAAVRGNDPLQDRWMLERGRDLPTLWIYADNSEVNARYWSDFGARSSRVMNLPFLNLCYETCVRANGKLYKVEVIGGLADLAVRLGGWESLPIPLQNPEAVVREPELNWIRAAVLAKWGGLWVSPATLWLRCIGPLPKDKPVFFGSDDEVTFVGPAGTAAPGLRVVWSPIPEHPVMTAWEEKARERLERRSGGSEFRRDEMSDAVDAIRAAEASGKGAEVRPTAELSRKGAAGRRIQLEDLLMAGQEGDLPFELKRGAAYVAIPWPELKERRAFGWFLRMSEEQIMDSDLVISTIFRQVLL